MTANRPWSIETARAARSAPRRVRCFAPGLDRGAETLELDPSESHHLVRVLRMGCGAAVEVFDGCGARADGVLIETGRKGVRLAVSGYRRDPPPRTGRILLQALPKGAKQDLVIQKAVELGATRLGFVESEHAVVRLRRRAGNAVDRWRRIAVSAAKQCGANRLPEFGIFASIEETRRWLPAGVRELVAHPAGAARPLYDVLAEWRGAGGADVAAWIGPEGGFSEEEVMQLVERGAVAVSLGPLVLRAETAALYCLCALGLLLGEAG